MLGLVEVEVSASLVVFGAEGVAASADQSLGKPNMYPGTSGLPGASLFLEICSAKLSDRIRKPEELQSAGRVYGPFECPLVPKLRLSAMIRTPIARHKLS